MRAVVCTMPGCGTPVAVREQKPLLGRETITLKTARHQKPDGTWCLVYAIPDPSVIFEVDGRAHASTRHSASDARRYRAKGPR